MEGARGVSGGLGLTVDSRTQKKGEGKEGKGLMGSRDQHLGGSGKVGFHVLSREWVSLSPYAEKKKEPIKDYKLQKEPHTR